ncbi:MAG: pyridoxine 5'-phosphate synthase [Phycisphaerales bacterium]|nr:pyridoxine 5'-phosphate synthase [Phycisphaerales bacterium]MCB9855889.1 pyridoxine 5'-phosphate synthase [Phycisphaerales bacterium]
MATLGVNIDHVATVRQARRTDEPDPVWAAVDAQLGGAACITFHLREDRRHIVDRDVPLLKEVVNVRLNMEMAIAPDVVDIACRTQPDQCCIVPEKREEVTTEGGLDVVRLGDRLRDVVARLRDAGCCVSAFIEPDPAQIDASAAAGFQTVELWTGGYAHARNADSQREAISSLVAGVRHAAQCGLIVHGGHGLTYRNVAPIAAIAGFEEFNIGHSIMARAMFVGIREAVREMNRLLQQHAPKE